LTPSRAASPIRLFKGPVSEILEVAYDDGNGDEQTVASFRLVEGAQAQSCCRPTTQSGR
jgi:hypothetical protein